jgi:NitT/TauT family transport system permease protein
MTRRGAASNVSKSVGWGMVPPGANSLARELPIVLAGIGFFYAVLAFARYWSGPMNSQAEISLSPSSLPKYALFSVLRIAAAYVISLIFTLLYGYTAAYHQRAEKFMIPLLDTLQSIPVLSFLPGVMISMVALFPSRQLGVELGSILLIFTGQVWNMTFSFYSSLKTIPAEMREAATAYRLSSWQRFWQLELPQAAIGLIWNSMMSVAGGWFFLMACEMFVLGSRDFRLPGLGSYLQTAANAGDTRAILWGVTTMIGTIIIIDQVVWRPVIAWAQKFKLEQVSGEEVRSPILTLLRGSKLLPFVSHSWVFPIREKLDLHFARMQQRSPVSSRRKSGVRWLAGLAGVLALAGLAYAVARMLSMLLTLSSAELRHILLGTGATFLRVEFALLLAAIWTIPAGVAIGLRPGLSAIAQPVAQVAASVPATALFPIILMILIRAGGGLGIGSIVLLLIGTQWYILFNVIAGAIAIPADLKEVCSAYRLGSLDRWRTLFFPAIFPYLITGLVTASGGAWNASIVAEYFHFRGQTISTLGLGAIISEATDSGNFRVLLGATVIMAMIVVTINRLVWRRLYGIAASRFTLQG